MENAQVGDLIRWIVDYKIYECGDTDIFPIDAVWAYGIVIEVSHEDPLSVVLVRLDNNTHQILHKTQDGFEIISKANGD